MALPLLLGYNLSLALSMPDANRLIDRLLSFPVPDGGLPYYAGNSSSAEPTALAALALFSAGAAAAKTAPLVSWLSKCQNKDGSLGISPSHHNQGLWLSALAALIFQRFGLREQLDKALGFVLSLKSATVPNDPRIKQDNTLVGWPWVRGTFAWVEPTSWALLALSAAGLADHARAVGGRKLLLDRQIPSGGWNYGNPGVNDTELLAFWDTTGLALTALGGRVPPASVKVSLAYLERDREKIDSPCGLAWAILGLDAWGRDASALKAKLSSILDAWPDAEVNAAHLALGIIALSGKKVLRS